MNRNDLVRRGIRLVWMAALLTSALSLGGCPANVGVGVSVGAPVGNHGYMSVGATRWR